jgi:hypothetical protein
MLADTVVPELNRSPIMASVSNKVIFPKQSIALFCLVERLCSK